MNAAVDIYSFKKKTKNFLWVAVFSFIFQNQAQAFFAASCSSFAAKARSQCNFAPAGDTAVQGLIADLEQRCNFADKSGYATAMSALGGLGAVAGPTVDAGAGSKAVSPAPVTNAATGSAGSLCGASVSSLVASPGCKVAVQELAQKCQSYSADATNTAGGLAATKSGFDALKGPLLGAAAGGLLGYMLGSNGDDESSSSAPEEEPPELPPAPETPPAESSSSSTSTTASNSSAGTGFETPAVVSIPTVDPNAEGGGGDSEILYAANDAIVLDDDGNVVEETDDGEGGTTTLGGTSGGGSTGNTAGEDSVVADNGDGDGRAVEDVVVQNDETVVGLVGASRGLAGSGGAFNFGGGSDSSQGEAGGSGSGMMMGVPTRARGRAGALPAAAPRSRGLSSAGRAAALSGSSNSSGATGSAAGMGAANPAPSSGQGSSAAPFRTRDQIREDLRRRGLIQ